MTKKLPRSTLAKVSAIFLITIDMIIAVILSAGILFMLYNDVYITSLNDIKNNIISDIAYDYAHASYYDFISGYDPAQRYNGTNFSLIIKDYEGNELFSTQNEKFLPQSNEISVEFPECIVYVYVDETFNATDRVSTIVKLVSFAYSWRYAAIVLDVVAIISFFILLVFLYFSAGYRSGSDTPSLPALGNIPFDLLTLMLVCAASFEIMILQELDSSYIFFPVLIIFFIADFVVFLLYTMNFAIRIKLGNLISCTLIYKLLSFFCRVCKSLLHLGITILKNLPLIWRTFVVFTALLIFEFIIIISYGTYEYDTMAVLWLCKNLIVFPVIILIALSLRNLQSGAKHIAEGDLNYQINTKYLFGDFKRSADDLNNINIGMQKAVDEKIRSERLKTELITNVSHDIKTPLTSIINYVDLIKKEPIANERVAEYINVLDRQSVRLKKLIEDLVEASKASTGNLPVNLAPCDVSVFLDQAVAEYDDKLKAADLELILNNTLFPVFIMADGRHLWRIFDNLLNNICKYALNHTRVYIDLQVISSNAVIIFRNISKYPLNISSDELMERFVRGDSSRKTEGSGLGLSIAKSLADLQDGVLDLIVDGDLFKVSLKFKTMEGR